MDETPKEDKRDNVIAPDFDAPRMDIRRRSPFDEGCKHIRIIVDANLRTVECRDCGYKLDPVEILLQIASKERRLYWKESTVRELQEKIKELRREEMRVRSRVRYWGRKHDCKDSTSQDGMGREPVQV